MNQLIVKYNKTARTLMNAFFRRRWVFFTNSVARLENKDCHGGQRPANSDYCNAVNVVIYMPAAFAGDGSWPAMTGEGIKILSAKRQPACRQAGKRQQNENELM